MHGLKVWLGAARLRTLPLSLSGIIVGSGIALANGYWATDIFVLSMLTTIAFQVLSNFANDLGDHQKGADNDERVGPKRSTQTGEISPSAMKQAVIVMTLLSLALAAALIFVASQEMSSQQIAFYAILGSASVVAAILYTMGKKAYGYNGLGDLMVFIFFGLVSVIGVYGLYAPQIDFWTIFPAVTIGMLSAGVLNLNNLRDHENDAKVGKRTLVVKMGFQKGIVYHFGLILTALIALTLFLFRYEGIGAAPLFFSVPLILHVKRVKEVSSPSELDPELKKLALMTFGIALSTAICIQFS